MAAASDHNPHDRLVKWVFTRRDAAGVLLRHVLAPRLSERIDWASLAVPSGNYVDPSLDERVGDILCTVEPLQSSPRPTIYVPIEHQSTIDRTMARRMAQSTGSLWHRHARDNPTQRHVTPLIIPVVLYQGARPWNQWLRLSEILDIPPTFRDVYTPSMELSFLLDALDGSVLDDSLASPGIVGLVECARRLLRWAYRPEEVTKDRVAQLVPLLERITDELGAVEIRTLWTYVTKAFADDSPLATLLYEAASPTMQQQFVSTYDVLIAKGQALGRIGAQGEILLQLIGQRRLALSQQQRQRIESCRDETTLRQWLDRVLTAPSVDALLGSDGR